MSVGIKMRESKKVRSSNIELLRIIAIISVILSHFNVHSGFREILNNNFNVNMLLSNIFSIGCVANCIFILITGYFLVGKKIKIKKIVSLILEMYFYSLTIFLIFKLFAPEKALYADMKSVLLPFPFGNWFCVCYIILYLMTPIINHVFLKISKKWQGISIIAALAISFVVGNVCAITTLNNLLAFATIYLIGSYIKIHGIEYTKKKKILFMAFMIATWLIATGLLYIATCVFNDSRFVWWGIKLAGRNTSVIVILFGLALFMIFKDIKFKNSAFINRIAASTLGVYLIHENPIIRRIIWKEMIPVDIYVVNPFLFVLICIFKVFTVFAVCTVIDIVRIKITEIIPRKVRK